MPIELNISHFEVKSTDVIHLKNFYCALHHYFWTERYSGQKRDAEFPEELNWEVRTQHHGKEIWIWWRPEKEVQQSKFYKRKFVVDIHGVGIKEVEVIRQNKKFKAQSGKVEVIVTAKLILDFKGEWERNAVLKHLLPLFWRRIWWPRLEQHKKAMLTDAYKLQEFVKRMMEMNTFSTERKPFMPAFGFVEENV